MAANLWKLHRAKVALALQELKALVDAKIPTLGAAAERGKISAVIVKLEDCALSTLVTQEALRLFVRKYQGYQEGRYTLGKRHLSFFLFVEEEIVMGDIWLRQLRSALSYPVPFERFLQGFAGLSNHEKGQYWEAFCQRFLQVKGYEVWTLKELPIDLRDQLRLRAQDMGIDLVVRDVTGQYSAVQCKYRSRQERSRRTINVASKSTTTGSVHGLGVPRRVVIPQNQVSWQELSTFYALCARTGPWKQHIVMTTANSVRHQGQRSTQDRTYAYQGFCGQPLSVWSAMVGDVGQRCDGASTVTTTPSALELRERRLAFYAGRLTARPVTESSVAQ
jgi:hypothetical protein